MYYLLFIVYLALFCVVINYIGFVKNAGLEKKTIVLLFLLKVVAGLCIGWISLTFLTGGDYFAAHNYGLEEYKVLKSDPHRFFTDVFRADYKNGYGGLFNSRNSFWHDLAGTCLYKLIGLFNIFSRGNFYINSLFLNFVGFFGHIALFRVFKEVYTDKKWLLVFGCFLIPSTLYFTSGLHKDNLVFTALCLFTYACYLLCIRAFSIRKALLLITAALTLFVIRNYVLIALIPAAVAMWFALKTGRTWLSFLVVYVLLCVLTIFIVKFAPASNPLQIVTQKQQDFFKLKPAKTQVYLDTLKPTFSSLADNLPRAFSHSFLRPFPWESTSLYLILPGAEIMLYFLLIVLSLLIRPERLKRPPPLILFGIFFSVTLMLFIGLVVPNLGSIIRYRSLYLPFLIIPALMHLGNLYYKK